MLNFTFHSPTKIIFGRDTENETGKEVKEYANKILLHYGGGSIKKSNLYNNIVKSLNDAGVEFIELSGVQPNPRLSLVHEGIKICRNENIGFILAVGGGSVIDSAKAIAAGVCYDGDVWDYYEKKQEITKAIPVGVVLTIPAAGSEASKFTVITNEDGCYKSLTMGEVLRPKFAIMNPELTCTLSQYQTVCGAADIMSHAMERYFTNVNNVDYTDRLCEATLQTIIKSIPIVLDNPNDYNSRAEIMWAATNAHNDLLGTGRQGDWTSHRLEHEISAMYDVAHGAGMAVVMLAWMKHVYKINVNRFAQFATRVWNEEYSFGNPESTAERGIKRLEIFYKSIGLPTSLSDLNIGDEKFEEMADRYITSGHKGDILVMTKKDAMEIYKIAL